MPDGPGGFGQGSSCPALLRVPRGTGHDRVRGFHPLRPDFPDGSANATGAADAALLPRERVATHAVWAPPRSLATTWGITVVFSSWGY